MTTGTDIDYTTRFISMRPDDDTRSIVELCEAERKEGYANMTDKEISNLIEYKQYEAERSKAIEIIKQESEEKLRLFKESLEQQRKDSRKMFDRIINSNPTFKSVKDGEDNGEG